MKISKMQLGFIAATILTIGVNSAANIIPFNEITTGEVSDIFHTYFVPAPYTFSIWFLIYALLILFAFRLNAVPEKEREYVKELGFFYWTAAIANSLWMVAWHYSFFLTTVALMFTIFFSLASIYTILKENKPKSVSEKTIIHIPFSVCFGWISVALIANISDVLWLLGWNGFGIAGSIWASIMMIITGILGAYMVFSMLDYAFAGVIVWALVGILVKFNHQKDMLVSGIIAILVVLGMVGFKVYQNKKMSSPQKTKETKDKKEKPKKKKSTTKKTEKKEKK